MYARNKYETTPNTWLEGKVASIRDGARDKIDLCVFTEPAIGEPLSQSEKFLTLRAWQLEGGTAQVLQIDLSKAEGMRLALALEDFFSREIKLRAEKVNRRNAEEDDDEDEEDAREGKSSSGETQGQNESAEDSTLEISHEVANTERPASEPGQEEQS